MFLYLLLCLFVSCNSAFLDWSVFQNDSVVETNFTMLEANFVEYDINLLYEKMVYEREAFIKPVEESVTEVFEENEPSWEYGFTVLNQNSGLQEKVLQEILRVKNESISIVELCTETANKTMECGQSYMFLLLNQNETQYVKQNLRSA